jgi:glutathione gamma-glutamylcysteinyltransferase
MFAKQVTNSLVRSQSIFSAVFFVAPSFSRNYVSKSRQLSSSFASITTTQTSRELLSITSISKSKENQQPPSPQMTFQGRKLPDHLVNFASPSGKELFKQALNDGYAESYFNLSSCFSHQMDPAYCGLSSLSIVLNALQVSDAPVWKGPWRWWYDEILNCCAKVEEVQKSGVTFDQFACLAKCHCDTIVKRANKVSKEEFISDLKTVCSRTDIFMIVSFSRKTLQQTGDGHYSPVGAYNPEQNMVLVLDTAR